jgi:hypothetical protein
MPWDLIADALLPAPAACLGWHLAQISNFILVLFSIASVVQHRLGNSLVIAVQLNQVSIL